jgi:hypothetical protein
MTIPAKSRYSVVLLLFATGLLSSALTVKAAVGSTDLDDSFVESAPVSSIVVSGDTVGLSCISPEPVGVKAVVGVVVEDGAIVENRIFLFKFELIINFDVGVGGIGVDVGLINGNVCTASLA